MKRRKSIILMHPNHLTDFGIWLWWRVPVFVWKKGDITGERISGIVARNGGGFLYVRTNAICGYWPHMRYSPYVIVKIAIRYLGSFSWRKKTKAGKRRRLIAFEKFNDKNYFSGMQ